MRHRSRSLPLVALVAIALVARPAPSSATKLVHAPRFALPARDGTVVSDSLRAKVVLVDFWASWCGPCRLSFPWMAALQQQYGTKGLTIVAIDLDKDRSLADAFLAEHPAPFRVAFDPAGKTAEAFAVSTMPSSFVLGPDGTVLYAHSGFDPKKTGPIEHLIQEACSR